MPAEIRHHDCRNRNVTESATATFDRNRNYAESVKIYSFGAETETETEIRSVFMKLFCRFYTNVQIASNCNEMKKIMKITLFSLFDIK